MRKKESGFNAKILLPLFVVFILVTSMFGYMFGSSKTRVDYNNHKFYQTETGNYILNSENIRIEFNNFPENLEWINATSGISTIFSTPMIYTTSNPESSQKNTIAEISFNLGQLLEETNQIYILNSFTSEGDHTLPIVTCANATFSVPVIEIKKSNSTEIIKEGTCVILKARNRQEMFMAYERLVYIILGVME